MVKVIRPFHADEASGTYGKSETYGKGRGVQYARQKGNPSNPRSDNQLAQRFFLRVQTEAITRINSGGIGREDGNEETPKEYYQRLVKAPDVWNNVHLTRGYPNSRENLSGDETAYFALSPEQQTAWGNWNNALPTPFEDVYGIVPEQNGLGAQIVAFTAAAAMGRSGYIANFDATTPPVWDTTPPPKKGKKEKGIIVGKVDKPIPKKTKGK